MWRFLAGVASALLLVGAGLFWRHAGGEVAIASAPLSAGRTIEDGSAPLPPAATEKTREEARFSRYDKDKDGHVSRDEFLAARHRAFAKLDTNSDGKLSFDEYAVKTTERFAKADADRSSTLDAAEFAATRIARNAAKPRCPPTSTAAAPAENDDAS